VRHLFTIILCALFAIACGNTDESSDDPSAAESAETEASDQTAAPDEGAEATDDAGVEDGDEAAAAEELPTEQDFEEEAIAEIDAEALKKAVDELEKEIGEDD
jgi:hypothetical protein